MAIASLVVLVLAIVQGMIYLLCCRDHFFFTLQVTASVSRTLIILEVVLIRAMLLSMTFLPASDVKGTILPSW